MVAGFGTFWSTVLSSFCSLPPTLDSVSFLPLSPLLFVCSPHPLTPLYVSKSHHQKLMRGSDSLIQGHSASRAPALPITKLYAHARDIQNV